MEEALGGVLEQVGRPDAEIRIAKHLAEYDYRSLRRLERSRILVAKKDQRVKEVQLKPGAGRGQRPTNRNRLPPQRRPHGDRQKPLAPLPLQHDPLFEHARSAAHRPEGHLNPNSGLAVLLQEALEPYFRSHRKP